MPRTKRVDDGMSYRSGAMTQLDLEQRSVEAVAATESPVDMPDFEQMRMVPEVLLMSGCRMPESRRVPLLNSHQRASTDDVIGSACDLRVEGKELRSRNVFSETAAATFKKVQEGHLKDVSVGYRIHKKLFVRDGETKQIAGRSFQGPVNVVTSWTIKELSVTPIGADEQAKMRGLQVNPFQQEQNVNKLLRAALIGRGMAVDLSDEQAIDWLVSRGMPKDADAALWVNDNLDKLPETINTAKTVASTGDGSRNTTATFVAAPAIDVNEAVREGIKQFRDELAAEEAKRKAWESTVRGLCSFGGMPELANQLIGECKSVDEVTTKLQEARAAKTVNLPATVGRMEFVADGKDKHLGVLRTAFLKRCVDNQFRDSKTVEMLLPKDSYAKGWEDYQNASMYEIARQCVELKGINTSRLSKEEIAREALRLPRPEERLTARDAAYHFTGSFAQLTLDAINKTLLGSYTERSMTWRQVFRQASSVQDFKTIHRIRLSEASNPSLWPDNTKPKEIAFSDEQETYAVEAYSDMASFSWRLLINDDMDALTRIPMRMGAAYARGVNAVAWAQITANPTMTDGQALFLETPAGNRQKSNYITGSATPTVSTLGSMRKLMRLQVGVNNPEGGASEAILNLEPRYIVVPAALETTAEQLLRSGADPASSNANVYNPFRSLNLIVEPLLDANSATAWYLFADSSQIDTVEVTFLQGYETPRTESWTDQETSALMYKIVQAYAAKAIDHRGMVKHKGAA